MTMEDKPTARYKDSGCSFVVEVQPDYDKEETEGNKGSSDDVTTGVTDQQALVHREEIPDDRSSGDYSSDVRNTPRFCELISILLFLIQVSKIHDCSGVPTPACHSQTFRYPAKARPIRATAMVIRSNMIPTTLVTPCTVAVTNPMSCRGSWKDDRNGWNLINHRT